MFYVYGPDTITLLLQELWGFFLNFQFLKSVFSTLPRANNAFNSEKAFHKIIEIIDLFRRGSNKNIEIMFVKCALSMDKFTLNMYTVPSINYLITEMLCYPCLELVLQWSKADSWKANS